VVASCARSGGGGSGAPAQRVEKGQREQLEQRESRGERPQVATVVVAARGRQRTGQLEVTAVKGEASAGAGGGVRINWPNWGGLGLIPYLGAIAAFALVRKLVADRFEKAVSKDARKAEQEGLDKRRPGVTITEEEEKELHVYKCQGCGYEIWPARGREFKFFPDSFTCPVCGAPKSEFWDLNDEDDPRNWEEEEEEEDGETDEAAAAEETGAEGEEKKDEASDVVASAAEESTEDSTDEKKESGEESSGPTAAGEVESTDSAESSEDKKA